VRLGRAHTGRIYLNDDHGYAVENAKELEALLAQRI